MCVDSGQVVVSAMSSNNVTDEEAMIYMMDALGKTPLGGEVIISFLVAMLRLLFVSNKNLQTRALNNNKNLIYGYLCNNAIWNWAIRKIENDGKDHTYHKKYDLHSLLNGVSRKLDIPSRSIQGILEMAWTSWQRCYKKLSKKPRLKGRRNRLNSIPFPDPIKYPTNNRIKLPKIGIVKFHKQEIPEGRIKCGRVVNRASGWYLCLFIDAMPKAIQAKKNRTVGIDPGLKNHLTTTDDDLNGLIAKDKRKDSKKLKPVLLRLKEGEKRNLFPD